MSLFRVLVLKLRLGFVARIESLLWGKLYCIRGEEKMKTKFSQRRRTLLVSGGLFSALLLGAAANVYVDDHAADRPAVEKKEGKVTRRHEPPMEPATPRDTARLVGPSAEQIHNFLYPTPEDGGVLTRAN
jgi:hypothetical protein